MQIKQKKSHTCANHECICYIKVPLMLALDYARFVVIRVLWFRQKNRSASELTRILNDECKFDEYVYLHCLQILYE